MIKNTKTNRLPAEWETQSGIQLTWPHAATDWAESLESVLPVYIEIATHILAREKLLVVAPCTQTVQKLLSHANLSNLILHEINSNDTWSRDHSFITTLKDNQPILNDFTFNGWGMKFAAHYDNQINRKLYRKKAFSETTIYNNCKQWVLEGGSIESDGLGSLMTTSQCMLSENRNPWLTKEDLEKQFSKLLGIDHFLWLNYGFLEGDDTDSHIDTLARFCDENTIAYVKCAEKTDNHYEELLQMENELMQFTKPDTSIYNLIPLPMAEPVFDKTGQRLPATYANFLIINHAVLMPLYQTKTDDIAKEILSHAFPGREIMGINCLPLIEQHGSLHCITMQFPKGVF